METKTKKQNQKRLLPLLKTMHCYRGLRTMPDRSPSKSNQFFTLRKDIIVYRDTTHVLFLGFGNDVQSVIKTGNQMAALFPNAHERFDKMQSEDRIKYRHSSQRLLTKASARFISRKLKIYMKQLQFLFGTTAVETLYHVSVLERMSSLQPYLPLYFMAVNSLLQSALNANPLYNKLGIKIRLKFINVSEQFFSVNNPKVLFRPHEVDKGRMTHRTDKAYEALFQTIHKAILCDVYY